MLCAPISAVIIFGKLPAVHIKSFLWIYVKPEVAINYPLVVASVSRIPDFDVNAKYNFALVES